MISRDDTWHGRYGVLPGYGITLQVLAAALWWFASSGGGLRVAVVMLVNEWGGVAWCGVLRRGVAWCGVVWVD